MNMFFNKKRCDLCNSKLRYSFTTSKLSIRRSDLDHKKDGSYTICEGCAGLIYNKLEHRG